MLMHPSASAASNVSSYPGYLSTQFENWIFQNSKKAENIIKSSVTEG